MGKNCCSPKQTKHHSKGKVDTFLLGIIVVTALVLGGVVYLGSKIGATAQVTTDTKVAVAIENNQFDWGTIDINGGIVSKTFAIENKGTAPLKLYDTKTSCMCTTAQLSTPAETSKKFGMHEKTSSVFEVSPGETAELLVDFDPAFHGPSGVGPISRTVTMNTNDPNNQTLSFQLSANVVKE